MALGFCWAAPRNSHLSTRQSRTFSPKAAPRTQHTTHPAHTTHTGATASQGRQAAARAWAGVGTWSRRACCRCIGGGGQERSTRRQLSTKQVMKPLRQDSHTYVARKTPHVKHPLLRVARKPLLLLYAAGGLRGCGSFSCASSWQQQQQQQAAACSTSPHTAHTTTAHARIVLSSIAPIYLPNRSPVLPLPHPQTQAQRLLPPTSPAPWTTLPPPHSLLQHHGGPGKNGPAGHPFLLPGRRAND